MTAAPAARAPRLVAVPEAGTRGTRATLVGSASPNLVIVHAGMGWPVGRVVPKAAFPHGWIDHWKLGAVVETDRPADVETALADQAAGIDPADSQLRGVVANLEGKIAAMRESLAERDATILQLRADLVAAEDRLRTAGAVAQTNADAADVARTAAPIPIVPAPWTQTAPAA